MKYSFEVNITEQDYYEFNEAHIMGVPNFKKQNLIFRIFFAVAFAFLALFPLISEPLTLNYVIFRIIPYAVLCLAVQLLYNPFWRWIIKGNIKTLKKQGKVPYSEHSVIEFYDDRFIERTETQTTEALYSSVERVCVANGESIYIYVNSVMAYILTKGSFDSKEQLEEFVEFMKTKTSKVDYYNKNK